MSEVFRTQQQVRFAHCDAAGWMFYPRAFELINGVVEDWFDNALGYSFSTMHLEDGLGVPTVHLETDFRAPSRLGETLDFELSVGALGRSSIDVRIAAANNGAARFEAMLKIVFVHLATGKSVPIPDRVRAAMKTFH